MTTPKRACSTAAPCLTRTRKARPEASSPSTTPRCDWPREISRKCFKHDALPPPLHQRRSYSAFPSSQAACTDDHECDGFVFGRAPREHWPHPAHGQGYYWRIKDVSPNEFKRDKNYTTYIKKPQHVRIRACLVCSSWV